MLRVIAGFVRGILTLAKPWWAWIGLLVLVNGLVPIFLFASLEAKVVLAAFLLAGGIQMAIFGFLGFVRLLGLGHIIAWIPLLVWIASRLPEIGAASALGRWLLAVLILDGVSLAIDVADVVRYLRGEREPSFTIDRVGG